MRPGFSPLLPCALLLASCAAQRSFAISSEPSGALVRLDGTPVGLTPLELDFYAYGTQRVALYLEGYQTHSELYELVAPWYARFPVDIVSEVLLPIGWHDHHELHVVLQPGSDVLSRPDLRSVLERAEVLRRAGPDGPGRLPVSRPVTPLPPAPDTEAALPEGGTAAESEAPPR